MGTIKQGILGGFSGKVGSVVGSSWKGIAVMKSMPLSVANPKTTSQVNNRTRFSVVSEVGAALGVAAMADLWNRFATKMSGYNLFCQVNKDCGNTDGTFDWTYCYFADGELQALIPTTFVPDYANHAVTITASSAELTDWLATDRYCVGIFDYESFECSFTDELDIPDAVTTFSVPMPASIETSGQIRYFLARYRADKTAVSKAQGRIVS
jgi:hypothetical protein